MSAYLDRAVATSARHNNGFHYPFDRGVELRKNFTFLLSRHIGKLESGSWFEGETLVVTGLSNSGKTKEVIELLKGYNADPVILEDGRRTQIVHCMLDKKGTWKDLGRMTLEALGYPISTRSRMNQAEIWARVTHQAKEQGVLGIYFDEVQHILSGRSEKELETLLDSFKTLMKQSRWPLMLIMSGVPELTAHVRAMDQVFTKVTFLHFEGIQLPTDYDLIHEVVGNYAVKNQLEVDEELLDADFYHRLATAAAYRWGLLIYILLDVIAIAAGEGAQVLRTEHFIRQWTNKTYMNAASTPYTHPSFENMFPPDKPFQKAIG